MSSSIWTRCAGASSIRPLRAEPWRAVEAQHQLSTRKLVDSADEQVLLEQLIDRVKPPARTAGALHYLLSTPFRYPPLRHGSRFGTRFERGIWYGSESLLTAFAEVAYYRFVFLEGTRADLGVVSTQLDVFRVSARTSHGIDLTVPPFAAHRRAIASRTRYRAPQQLGADMRASGVVLVRYPSARDTTDGINIGVFDPIAFGAAKPGRFESWQCLTTREQVELVKRGYAARATHLFPRRQFLVAGKLPTPAL